jgi:hypothetical protein
MDYDMNFSASSDELTHWGIVGMKWGVRRYQNKDGSLTPAGKRKLKRETEALKQEEAVLKNRKATKAKFDRLEAKRKALADQKKALDEDETDKKNTDDTNGPAKKSLKDMTLAELRAANERSRLEEEYRRYNPEPAPVEKNPLMKKMLNDVVVPAATNAGRKFAENAFNKLADKVLGEKVDPNSLEALKKTYDKLDYKQKIDKILNPDKYLSEEDRNKRQQRAFDAEDRASKLRGYKDAADEAAAKRDADAATAKRKADEAARAANDEKSREYYNSTYNNKGVGERTAAGKSTPNSLAVQNSPVSNLSKPNSSVTKGKRAIDSHANDNTYELIDKGGNVILSWGEND